LAPIFYRNAITHSSLKNHVFDIHTSDHKKGEWELQNIELESNALDAAVVSLPTGHDQSTTDRIKDFAKRETSHLELNHKLRAAELTSYREDLVFQRRLMLFLAYVMASVFTALSLWLVCFVFCTA